MRKAYPILQRSRFLSGQLNEELQVKDVTWLSPAGVEMDNSQWGDARAKCFGMLLDGRAQPTGIKRRGEDATLLLVMNAHHDVVDFALPVVPEGRDWICVMDTNTTSAKPQTFSFGDVYRATGRSFLVFELRRDVEA